MSCRPGPFRMTRPIYSIDQAWGQDGSILAKFFFCIIMHWDEVKVHKNTKREHEQYPAILTEQA